MRLDVRPIGEAAAANRFTTLGQRARNTRPMFLAISDDLGEIGRRRFASAGDGQWRQPKAASVARKRRAGQPAKAGHATGRLSRSLSQPVGTDTRRRINQGAGVMEWTTRVWYARFELRDWYRLSPADRDQIVQRMNAWLLHGRA